VSRLNCRFRASSVSVEHAEHATLVTPKRHKSNTPFLLLGTLFVVRSEVSRQSSNSVHWSGGP
jgi:hypothetical protein